MTLQQFLVDRTLGLTLTNEQGGAVYLGEVITVKPQKDRHFLSFTGTLKEGTYTKAILHSGRRIFSIITIIPVKVEGSTSIELVY